jgi:hypothetical protein
MVQTLARYKWWLLLTVLLILNAIRYWPAKHASRAFVGGPPPGAMGANGFPPPDAAMQARIDALPDDQRKAVEDRIQEDKDFFASVQTLPDTERQQKVMEHFAQNPPPPGMPFPGPGGGPPGLGGGAGGPGPVGPGNGGPGNGGPGGPGDGGTPRIPPPEVRRSMDQGLVNAMKSAGIQ